MSDKSTLFREAMQATLIGMSSAANMQQVLPAPPVTAAEFGTADHGIPKRTAAQTVDADQPPMTSAAGATSDDDGSHTGITTDPHSFVGAASTATHAEQFEIHMTTWAERGSATAGIIVDADVQMVVAPNHPPAGSPIAAESPVPGVALHAHWHAEIAEINSAYPSLSGTAIAGVSSAVQIMSAPAAVDAPSVVASSTDTAIALASLDNGGHITSSVPAGWAGVPANEVLAALGGSGASVTGAGIKVGVLSDSFNDLGGAATDEADGALPSAASIQILKDAGSGGTDEGRAMMQIVHDIAPSAGLAFYTAFDSEQDFANGILALAAAGCKVICDDVSYYDEPFFQNGVVAQAIQTVEAEGVTYVSAAGNDGSAAYQAAWSPISGTFDGVALTDAESFGGSIVQTITVTASSSNPLPLLLEWNQAYGQDTSNLEMLIFHNGSLVGESLHQGTSEPTNPWMGYQFTSSGTYQIAIENVSGPNPGLIKEIAAGDGLPVTISGANVGTVYGHAMTPGVISAGAVDSAVTPAFGYGALANESFSSSGAGTELLFANNGTALSSPLALNAVTVSGIDDISTTITGGLHDFYGTSAASASLAGAAALILTANPSLTPAQVAEIMQDTAISMSNSAVAGAGLVQINAAIAEAQSFITHVIEATGSTKLVQVGPNDFLDPVGAGTGPELMFGGKAVTTTLLGGWQPIAAETFGSGYQVAFKMQGQDLYTAWNTDNNGNYTSNAIGTVSGSSFALETLETNVHQDLNGDGLIGVYTNTIESSGVTSLVQVANNYFLDPAGGGSGPTLKYGGTAVIAGSLSGWTPIGAEAVGAGYEVAFKMQGQDLYTVWNTDGNGNYTGNAVGTVSGSSIALETMETNLQQDLNGDGHVGAVSTTIEANGATSLVQTANNYFLDPVGGGTGPSLKYGGAAVIAGSLGGWTPIGAEAVGAGYDVAFKMLGQDLYVVWTTDSSGNYTADASGAVSGSSFALETLETTLQQDLNGDGHIGAVSTTIEAYGATSLVQLSNNYVLDPVGGGTGPTLKYGGAAVIAGTLSGWTPIGAEAVGGGYDIAFKMQGHDLYTVWTTDSSGNYTANAVGTVSGNNAALEAAETSFHQDLNGDGTIGVVPGSSSIAAIQAVVQSSSNVSFDGHSLTLVSPATFDGHIIGFGTDSTEQIDLNGIAFAAPQTSFDGTAGKLALTDAYTTAQLHFAGPYSQDSFHFSDDGHGGTLISMASPTAPTPSPSISGQAVFAGGPHDSFVFAPNFGQTSIANFNPSTDSISFSKSVFASQDALAAAIHNDAAGNAVITDAAHDTITLQHVATAQLLTHLTDFHIV